MFNIFYYLLFNLLLNIYIYYNRNINTSFLLIYLSIIFLITYIYTVEAR